MSLIFPSVSPCFKGKIIRRPPRRPELSAAAAPGASAAPRSWRGGAAADAAYDASPEKPPNGKSHGFLHELWENQWKLWDKIWEIMGQFQVNMGKFMENPWFSLIWDGFHRDLLDWGLTINK